MSIKITTETSHAVKPGHVTYPHVNSLVGPIINIHDAMLNSDSLNILQTFKVPKSAHEQNPLVDIPLASDFGHLAKKDVDKMTETALISCYILKKSLELNLKDQFFSSVVILLKNTFFQEVHEGDGTKVFEGEFSKRNKELIDKDKDVTDANIKELKRWLVKNIQDPLAYESLEIDKYVKHLAEVAFRRAGIKSLDTILKTYSSTIKVLDVSVLVFPDVERPYVTVYKCSIEAFYKDELWYGHKKNTDEIHGIYVTFRETKLKMPDIIAKGLHDRPKLIESGKKFLVNELSMSS